MSVPPANSTPTNADLGSRLRSSSQFFVALGVTVAFLVYLLAVPASPRQVEVDETAKINDAAIEVAGPGLIRMKPGGALDKKIVLTAVRTEKLTTPELMVTGRVVASLRPGKTPDKNFWQFDSAEVQATYNDWQKAQAEIIYTQMQLVQVKKLAELRLSAQTEVVKRLEKLVAGGTDSVKDLTAEKANLMQMEVTGKKDVHEATSAFQVAERSEAAMSRQLQQAGLDPEFLKSTTSDFDVVMADVPEAKLSLVTQGRASIAKFFGLPNRKFDGTVSSIAPVLSKERRSLRVLLLIADLKDELRPGMFADIGIGTELRNTTLMPAEGILHIGRHDYALVAAEDDTWRVIEVEIGEPHGGDVQILKGLQPGQRVVGKGAILLKPLVMRSLALLAAKEGNGQ